MIKCLMYELLTVARCGGVSWPQPRVGDYARLADKGDEGMVGVAPPPVRIV